jgi:uncharacterized cupin superfamily protein
VPAVPNVHEPEWDMEYDFPPLRGKYARVGKQAGAERLGAAVYEVPPGAVASPLHVHHANEEMILVLEGTPTLRTAEGSEQLAPGDVVSCPRGRAGAHRVENRSGTPARVLIVSTMVNPEVAEHLDSEKVLAATGDDPGADVFLTFRKQDAVPQFLGEVDDTDGPPGG